MGLCRQVEARSGDQSDTVFSEISSSHAEESGLRDFLGDRDCHGRRPPQNHRRLVRATEVGVFDEQVGQVPAGITGKDSE